jgi:hypothetical protein
MLFSIVLRFACEVEIAVPRAKLRVLPEAFGNGGLFPSADSQTERAK